MADQMAAVVSSENMINAASMIYVVGHRLWDGRLRIGDATVDEWVPSFKVAGVPFKFTDEEEIGGEDDGSDVRTVQACYFRSSHGSDMLNEDQKATTGV